MEPTARFYPIEGGGFQSWNPTTGASVRARLTDSGDAASFVLSRGPGEVVARR